MAKRDARHVTADDQRAIDGVSDVIDVSVINPRSMLPAYLQLAIYLRGMIIVRQLPPGSPLPSEPELAQRYGVSRDTVRRAMQLLREIGLAETRRGVGHFVTRTPEIRRVVVAPGSRVSGADAAAERDGGAARPDRVRRDRARQGAGRLRHGADAAGVPPDGRGGQITRPRRGRRRMPAPALRSATVPPGA